MAAATQPDGTKKNDGGAAAATAPTSGGGSPFRIMKPGQGIHVRWATAIGAAALAVAGAHWAFTMLDREVDNFTVVTLVTVALLVAMLYGIFWVVGRYQTAVDFLIATEGEMKKVNWSTRKEVFGATKVVIVTVLAMGFLLAIVDAVLMLVMGGIGVLKHVKLFQLFSGGGDL